MFTLDKANWRGRRGLVSALLAGLLTVALVGSAMPAGAQSGNPAQSSQSGLSGKTAPCQITFTDVQPSDYFYDAVNYLYCHKVISGYDDNTFAPYNYVTRAQMTKMVVLGFGIPLWTPPPSAGAILFSDVPRTDSFFTYIATAAHNNIVSGYADGTFRPYANITRGQLSKIVVQGGVKVHSWALTNYPLPAYVDVQPDNPFYTYIETAYCHKIISGYADGTFRPSANATRGQVSKIVYLAVMNANTCETAPASAKP